MESSNDKNIEPTATDAANLRFRCLANALRPAARTGIEGISQRFWTIQVMSSQEMVQGGTAKNAILQRGEHVGKVRRLTRRAGDNYILFRESKKNRDVMGADF